MVVFYYGADAPSDELKRTGYKRRNTVILKTLSENNSIAKVFSFINTNRKKFLKHFFANFRTGEDKIKDIYFTEIFVFGKFKIPFLNKLFNKLYFGFLKQIHSKKNILGWIYWPQGYLDFKLVNIRLTFVFDADHNIVDDPNLAPENKVKLEKLLKEISKRATVVVSASRSMLNWFKQYGARQTYRLRNGIELSRFQIQPVSKPEKFTVVYCGILSNWVDYHLFKEVILSNPDIDFVIIGKSFLSDSYRELEEFDNVFLWGEKTAEEVAVMLPGFHAGLGFYVRTPFLDGDSMKVYEYLAAGLPVVCTDYHESLREDFNDLLFLGNSLPEFNACLKNIRNGSISVKKIETAEFLHNATWEKRISDALVNIGI